MQRRAPWEMGEKALKPRYPAFKVKKRRRKDIHDREKTILFSLDTLRDSICSS